MKPLDIKLNPENPRIIKDDKFKKLVKSLKDFPEMAKIRPVVIDENNMVLGGNMRLKAMIEAGWTDIPVKKVEGWTEEQKREFIVKDNLGYGEWDYDILANEYDLQELDDWGMDVPEDLKPVPEIEEDEAPEVSSEPPVSKLGEVYQLGRHRLMCGDSTKIEDVEKLMNGNKADMVFTDPPYGMNLDTNYADIYKNAVAKTSNQERVLNDKEVWNFNDVPNFECGEQFWWGADYYRYNLPVGGSWFVWDKEIGKGRIGNEFELCWSKFPHKRSIVRKEWAGFRGLSEKDGKRVHPTQKPIELCSWFIKNYSDKDNIIIDLFGGSGSTLIACEQLDRTCYMMELDPKYVDVIRKRYHKFVKGSEEGWEEGTPTI